MTIQLRAGAFALALLGSVSMAAAQGGGPQQEKLNLNQSQERSVSQGLAREQSQSAPGYQGQVGSTPPSSLTPQPLPNGVTADVPATKNYLFVKLPDRILLIDPDTHLVAEIVGAPATTGSGPAGSPSSPSGSPSSPSGSSSGPSGSPSQGSQPK
jgi:hypothetical protein